MEIMLYNPPIERYLVLFFAYISESIFEDSCIILELILKKYWEKILATYKEIIADVKVRTGKEIHHPCWIAHVKSMHGLTTRQAHNRQDPSKRVKPCPDEWVREIEISLINLGMICSTSVRKK